MNDFNLKYKNNYDNVWDIEESLFDTNENCFVGKYEITLVFYNETLKYCLIYHKTMFSEEDSLELYTNGCFIKEIVREYWNNIKLNEIVEKLKYVSIYEKVNKILDTMDNFIEEQNKVFVDFLGMIKNEFTNQ